MVFDRLMRAFQTKGDGSASVESCITTLDRSIPTFRTVLLVAGIAGAALNIDPTADYLFAAGLLLQFSIWFENWWLALRTH